MCVDDRTGSWIRSFATASCLSGRFRFLLSLVLPKGLPVCVRAEKHVLALFLRQSGFHSGQNLGVKNVSEHTRSCTQNLRRSRDLMLHVTLFFNVRTQTVTNDLFLFCCLFLLGLCGASRRPCDLAHADLPADSTGPPGGLRSAHVPAGFGNQHHHVSKSRHFGYLSSSSVWSSG